MKKSKAGYACEDCKNSYLTFQYQKFLGNKKISISSLHFWRLSYFKFVSDSLTMLEAGILLALELISQLLSDLHTTFSLLFAQFYKSLQIGLLVFKELLF